MLRFVYYNCQFWFEMMDRSDELNKIWAILGRFYGIKGKFD